MSSLWVCCASAERRIGGKQKDHPAGGLVCTKLTRRTTQNYVLSVSVRPRLAPAHARRLPLFVGRTGCRRSVVAPSRPLRGCGRIQGQRGSSGAPEGAGACRSTTSRPGSAMRVNQRAERGQGASATGTVAERCGRGQEQRDRLGDQERSGACRPTAGRPEQMVSGITITTADRVPEQHCSSGCGAGSRFDGFPAFHH